MTDNQTRVVSRLGNLYRSFPDLCAAIHIVLDCEAVLGGEIDALDSEGRSQFYELFRRRGRGEPVFDVRQVLSDHENSLKPVNLKV